MACEYAALPGNQSQTSGGLPFCLSFIHLTKMVTSTLYQARSSMPGMQGGRKDMGLCSLGVDSLAGKVNQRTVSLVKTLFS